MPRSYRRPDPGAFRRDSHVNEAERGRAIRRCREAGFDPLVADNWKRFTDAEVRKREALYGRPPETPAEPPKRSFSPVEREPWLNRTEQDVDRARNDAQRRMEESMKPGYGRRDYHRF